jgi:hypothetical protein
MRTRFVAALTALLTFTSATGRAQETPAPSSHGPPLSAENNSWKPGNPIPPGYHPVERVRKGLIIAGAVSLGASYLLSALGATVAGGSGSPCTSGFASLWCGGGSPRNARNEDVAALYIPVLGPFWQMTVTTDAGGNVLNFIDGAAQSAGLAMLIIGLASPRKELVRNDFEVIRALPVPYVTSHSAGLGLVASF